MSIIDQLQLVTLADICSSEPLYTIEPNATLTEALEKMNENHVTCLPVITTNSITGFFDIRDAMVYLACMKSFYFIFFSHVYKRGQIQDLW